MIAGLNPYPEMKPSGVPWLGEVPAYWQVKKLNHIGRFFKGNGGTKDDALAVGIPCVRYGDLYTTHSFFVRKARTYIDAERALSYTPIQYGDVLFAASGETIDDIGKSAVNLIIGEARCGGDTIVLRPDPDLHPQFLGYATDCRPTAIQKAMAGRGTTVKHLYPAELKQIRVAIPPPGEQRLIVQFLDWHGAQTAKLIRAKKRTIALLNEEKQAIIHCAVTRGLDPNVKLKPSGIPWLGDVPDGWEIQRLGRLLDLTAGFAFNSSGFTDSDDDIRLLRGINLSPGKIRWRSVVRWPVKDAERFSVFALRVGDIVVGMDRPIIQSGIRIARVSDEDVPSLLLQRVARVRFLTEVDEQFGFLILGGKGFIDYLTPIFSGISVPHISPQQISNFRFALPTIDEQRQIVEAIDVRARDITSALRRIEREIALIQEFRTRLIADVVTGKLDVRAAAASLPEVAEPEPIDDLAEDDDVGEADVMEEEEVAA